MQIDTSKTEVSFVFSPSTHWLVYSTDDRFPNSKMKVWTLNPRIDRSEKGKDDDVAVAEIYLSDSESEQLKKAGFDWMEMM